MSARQSIENPTERKSRTLPLMAGTLTVALTCLGTWLMLSEAGAVLHHEVTNRSPQELIRYTLRRLEGHPKLEWVLHPALFALQRRVEREPPGGLPTHGKGQQTAGLPAPRGITQDVQVDTPQAIRQALLTATAGTRITVAPGLYPFAQKLRLRYAGDPDQPILLTAAEPGSVVFEFRQVEGILVDQPHWVFENLRIHGVCGRHDDCEHAFHVVGAARHTTIRNNEIRDFNAHIKVNGYADRWPDDGILTHNTLYNRVPRDTTRSVTPFDLVGANGWRVQDNVIKDFAKANGNKVAFGIFMKGASENGRIERNLIICSSTNISAPGVRVGLSFGGGGTDGAVCRTNGCHAFEHRHGVAANNVIAHCNDVGIDINRATGIDLIHNTLVNTAGISARNAPAHAALHANLVDGSLYARNGGQLAAISPQRTATDAVEAADILRLRPLASLQLEPRELLVTNDFFGRQRQDMTAPGAVEAQPPGTQP
jgi:hypothetical protein